MKLKCHLIYPKTGGIFTILVSGDAGLADSGNSSPSNSGIRALFAVCSSDSKNSEPAVLELEL